MTCPLAVTCCKRPSLSAFCLPTTLWPPSTERKTSHKFHRWTICGHTQAIKVFKSWGVQETVTVRRRGQRGDQQCTGVPWGSHSTEGGRQVNTEKTQLDFH